VRHFSTLLIATILLALLAFGAPTSTAADPYWGPAYRACGRQTFHSHEQGTVRVYVAEQHTTCKTARKIQREYWTAPNSRLTIIAGGTGAAGYVLLKRYPGWKCTSGAGAGSCQKSRRFAGYSFSRS